MRVKDAPAALSRSFSAAVPSFRGSSSRKSITATTLAASAMTSARVTARAVRGPPLGGASMSVGPGYPAAVTMEPVHAPRLSPGPDGPLCAVAALGAGGPPPARARGAALLFMYASSLAAVAPGVGVGPLEPVDLVDAANAKLPDDAALERMASGWAEVRGRPTPAFPSSVVPAQDALDGH